MMRCAFVSSRFPVGSSASRIGVSHTNALAIATRCCSPPLSVNGNAFFLWVNHTFSMISSVEKRLLMLFNCIVRLIFSSTVRWGRRWNAWNMKLMCCHLHFVFWSSLIDVKSCQLTMIDHLLGVSSHETRFKSVDFHDHDGHMIATNSPVLISIDASWKIVIGHSVLAYCFVMLLIDIMVLFYK
jgi:hypothetical protein